MEMNFLRENAFMVSLTTGTIVLCLILVVWSNSISTKIDEQEIQPRESLSDTIQHLSRPPYANGNTIMAERNRVEGIVESLRKVVNENIAWNSRNFKVPSLTMLDGSTRPAFPFDAAVWKNNQLASRFVGQYHGKLDSLLASLKAVRLSTQTEFEEEVEHQRKILTRREQIRRKGQKDAAGTTPKKSAHHPTVMREVHPEMMEPDMMDAGPRHATVRRSSSSFDDEANLRARDILRVRKAREGLIYADDTPFHLEYARNVKLISASDVDPQKLWDAQVGLWVQSDIVDAVRNTIQTVQDQQNIPPEQRNVITSPVKRLIDITVGESDPSSRKRTTDRNANIMPPPDMRGYHDEMYHPDERYGHRSRSSRKDRKRQTTETSRVQPDTLTQNAANKIFDVVDYSFTVLMPTRYLPLLEESLLKRNYHVILNMQIAPPDAEETGLYYYGVEPLRKVTIEGQLLLMTGFTRGLWNNEKKQWLREPLMPIDVIKKLPASALRNEDRLLIEGRLHQPWSPSAETPKAEEPPRPEPRFPRRRKIVRPTY